MPQLFVPSIGSEDKRIMVERARLEYIWESQISPTDQAAWLTQWATTPPQDAKGRKYQFTTKTALNQTVLPAQTVYAWSQEFATLRFQLPAVLTPSGLPGDEIIAFWLKLTIDEQRVQVQRSPGGPGNYPILVYVTTPVLPGTAFNVRQFRLVALFPEAFDTADFPVAAPLPLDPNQALGCEFYVRAFTVTPDNTLGPPHAPSGAILT